MKHPATRSILASLLAASAAIAAESQAEPLPGLTYFPDGDAIVIRNGTRWNNRPLYCNQREMVILAGEMPGLSSPLGRLRAGVVRGDQHLLLDQFAQRIMRYRPGRVEWELSDPKLPGLALAMTATTVAEGDGFVVRIESTGAAAGDDLVWLWFPPNAKKGGENALRVNAGSFGIGAIAGTLSKAPSRTQEIDPKRQGNLEELLSAATAKVPAGGEIGLALTVPLAAARAHALAVVDTQTTRQSPAQRAFDEGLARVTALGRQVVVDTPDPHFNAGVGASCASMYGLYVAPYFAHGGTLWRMCFPGWRIMDGATAYGWHDLVGVASQYHGDSQASEPDHKTRAEADGLGAEQSANSRFHGLGKVNTAGRYDMQTQFFDQCVRDWRATGDRTYESMLLPMLELHLQWAKDCFDPDDDGLYESYINTWPSDSVWYNGGGTVEESAYIFYQRRAAAEMCRRAGKDKAATEHDDEADKIHEAVNRILWLKDKGQYAASIEQGAHRRIHDDAWIYSEHLPIEAGLATPQQAWQAMYYTDWAMEHYKLPYGGEMRQTSNFVPGQWTARELYHGDNFAMALGYFLAGQGDEGWELLRGPMMESMYGDTAPKAGYTDEQNTFNKQQLISPGGLSHPNCGIDFNDITSMFCRSVVEGLFGYRPDYPNRAVTVAPAFPSAWDHASIKTPDYELAFKRDGDVDRYTISLARPAMMRIRLPVCARTVKSVTVNGRESEWNIEPWAGFGMLMLDLPECGTAQVAVTPADRTPPAAPVVIEKTVGAKTVVADAIDPQGCLGPEVRPGHHMAFARVQRGKVPYFQVYKVNVTDPVAEARRAEKNLRQAPADAKWTTIAMTDVFNGDIRTIFRQDYASPRPDTVSCRIGRDGWTAWTVGLWKIAVPDVKLDHLAALEDRDRHLVTPQGAVFAPVAPDKNIAFTSLWDNWPRAVTVPVNKRGDAIWLLVCGNTNPMQGRIANAVLRFHYADGREECLELVPPMNFWSLCRFGNADYSYEQDGFALPKDPPLQVQLGENCRAMVYGWKLRPDIDLKEVTLETLSQEVVIGLMGVSMMEAK